MAASEKSGVLRGNASAVSFLQRMADAGWIVIAQYVACLFYGQVWGTQNTVVACLAVVAFHMSAEAFGLYRPWRGAPFRQELLRIFGTWAVVVPALLILGFTTKTTASYSRFVTASWFVLAPSLIMAWRSAVRVALHELRRGGFNQRTVAIAGATPLGNQVAQRINSDPSYGMKVVGYYDDRGAGRRAELAPGSGGFIGGLSQLVTDARAGKIDIVYVALPLKAEPRINHLVRRLADSTTSVFVVADFFVFDLMHARWSNLGDLPVVSIFDTPFSGASGSMKRVEDLILGSLLLLTVSIPMLLVALAIKLTSNGPIFFRQKRYGLNGREIRVWKFRTMSVCEDGASVSQARKGDARVTPLGRILRKTSLDELPQFFNVLGGEMSIVGPRPHAVAHNEEYRSQIHGYMLRHKVKPGITGWAQVNGWRGETDTVEKMERRVEHDLHYINNWNVWWDLQIIFLTVFGRKTGLNAH